MNNNDIEIEIESSTSTTPTSCYPDYFPSPTLLLRALMMLSFMLFIPYLTRRSNRNRRSLNLRINAAKKRKQREEVRQNMNEKLVDACKNITPARASSLLNMSVDDVHAALHKHHSFTCVEVTAFFLLRCITADQLLDCNAEEFPAQALEQAVLIDQRIASRKHGRDKSTPSVFEGVPITVKDIFEQQGADSTCGLAARLFKPFTKESLLLQVLREQGAIFIVRSSVPQLLLLPESMNAFSGHTLNPYNPSRTCGGSSGGEGVLLSARCSIVGLGTDIGGSLRIPAAFCGVAALKPTSGRLSSHGVSAPTLLNESGQNSILPTAGPMARNVNDLIHIMKLWLSPSSVIYEQDKTLVRVPWQSDKETLPKKKLRFGYYKNDGWFDSSPSYHRAIDSLVDTLTKAGHECVKFQPPHIDRAIACYYATLSADGAQVMKEALDGEEMHEYYKELMLLAAIPQVFKPALCWLLRTLGESRAAIIAKALGAKSAKQLWDLNVIRSLYVDQFMQLWAKQNIDFILCPSMGLPAFTHGASRDLTLSCSYTFLYNLLNFPSGTLPITYVRSNEQKYESRVRDRFTQKAAAVCANSEGLPIAVQVVGLPYDDEKVLSCMRLIEQLVKFQPEMSEAEKQINQQLGYGNSNDDKQAETSISNNNSAAEKNSRKKK